NGRSKDTIVYQVFDLIHSRGRDLRREKLSQRKARLSEILAEAKSPLVRYCDHVRGDGAAFFEMACKHGLEGIVSKHADAPYPAGRSKRWLKVRCKRRQELVIAGYTPH